MGSSFHRKWISVSLLVLCIVLHLSWTILGDEAKLEEARFGGRDDCRFGGGPRCRGGELVMILLLLFKTPLRRLVIVTLDKVKQGRGPVIVKTVDATLCVVLASSIYNAFSIHTRNNESGAVVNPTDQFLMYKHLLEASTIGSVLCLSMMIDRFHHYIRELQMLRKTMEAAKKQFRSSEDGKSGGDITEEQKPMMDEAALLRPKVKQLESECEVKQSKAKALEVEVESLKKQSEGLLVEYDRLLVDNQNLRSQLEVDDKKSM
ncbi:B-cell receptor-associated protein 31-like [Senna tora]|uniref:Endoplasmic reticulum transmembrane protein n=1 Tax=Senna tora TaxID=362788 RepID=A0A834TL65_9FABA|nr:B-cell receptor-associated protein 31-like [Senna tora]